MEAHVWSNIVDVGVVMFLDGDMLPSDFTWVVAVGLAVVHPDPGFI